jgi:hypothetical protein
MTKATKAYSFFFPCKTGQALYCSQHPCIYILHISFPTSTNRMYALITFLRLYQIA